MTNFKVRFFGNFRKILSWDTCTNISLVTQLWKINWHYDFVLVVVVPDVIMIMVVIIWKVSKWYEIFRGYDFTGDQIVDFPVDYSMCLTTRRANALLVIGRFTSIILFFSHTSCLTAAKDIVYALNSILLCHFTYMLEEVFENLCDKVKTYIGRTLCD